MPWNKTFFLFISVLLFAGNLYPQDSTGTRPLWNVTTNGDTLKYVNVIPSRSPFQRILSPQYVTKWEWDNLMGQSADTSLIGYPFTDVKVSGLSIDPELDRIRQIQSTHKSLWKPIVSMIASGAVSAYFKLEANHAYEQYRQSLDQSSINYYYDRTRKYDTYSTISFVLFQGSFGWMIYKLIR